MSTEPGAKTSVAFATLSTRSMILSPSVSLGLDVTSLSDNFCFDIFKGCFKGRTTRQPCLRANLSQKRLARDFGSRG